MERLNRVTRGVWRPPEATSEFDGRAAALLTCLPEETVLVDCAAGRLHGVWLPDVHDDGPIAFVLRSDAEVPRAHSGSSRDEVHARRRRLRADEIVIRHGLPVTSLARTWVDLAEHLDLPDLVAAGDSTVRLGATITDLETAVRRAAGRRGVRRARAALPLLDGRSRSRPESHLRVGLVSRGLVPSGVNTPVRDDVGQWLGEPDLSFDDARLAVEYNGADHAQSRRMRHDITREIDFGDRGCWQMIVVGPTEVFRRMDQTAAYIARVRLDRLRRLA